ncbi:M20/M25/M40 family metallo-hydrolase [Cedecea davisae]|uniref:M20/M25/M40 family metallo-hydrolase n=1 Tax=Cedecea davisae TaxID=158484 RepID=UPI00376F05D2
MSQLEATLDLLRQITPFESVAGNIGQQRELAAWLERWLVEETDAEVLFPVAGQLQDSAPPLVHVRVDIGSPRTLVLYNMYDVMPADTAGWEVDPFVGGLKHWPDKGEVFISRGAENNKGPLAGMLMVVRDLYHSGRLHANIEILLEGEEEIGSGNLRRYLAQQPCPINPAEAVLFPSLCEYGGGAPRLYLGFTGRSGGRLQVKGGSWGGPKAAIHASNAAWIDNPVWRLVQALNTLAPAHANGVLETGKLDEEARSILDELAANFNPDDELTFRRSEKFSIEGDSYSLLAYLLGSAVLNISEIASLPHGAQGVIPPEAFADLVLRTPPVVDGEKLMRRIEQQVAALSGVELVPGDSYPGYRFSIDDPGVAELMVSYHQQHARPQIWPWAPGCAPAYAFAPVAPAFLIGGLGYGGNAHGVNEFVTLLGLQRFQQSLNDWLVAF